MKYNYNDPQILFVDLDNADVIATSLTEGDGPAPTSMEANSRNNPIWDD